MKPFPPRSQIAVIRFAGRPARVPASVALFSFVPCIIAAGVVSVSRKPLNTEAWVVVAALVVYAAAVAVAAAVRFARSRSLLDPPDPRVDERLSDAAARAGLSERRVRRLNRRRLNRITETLGYEPPRLWISSRLAYSGINQQPTDPSGLFSLAHSSTPWGIRDYLVIGAAGTISLTIAIVAAISLADPRGRDGAWIGLAVAALPPAWAMTSWTCRFSAIGLGPGRITLYRRWRIWIHTAARLLRITKAHAPARGRSVNPSDVRVIMVLHPVAPDTREAMWRAVFDTRARGPEHVYSWVFIGADRPRAFRRVSVDTWRLVLHSVEATPR